MSEPFKPVALETGCRCLLPVLRVASDFTFCWYSLHIDSVEGFPRFSSLCGLTNDELVEFMVKMKMMFGSGIKEFIRTAKCKFDLNIDFYETRLDQAKLPLKFIGIGKVPRHTPKMPRHTPKMQLSWFESGRRYSPFDGSFVELHKQVRDQLIEEKLIAIPEGRAPVPNEQPRVSLRRSRKSWVTDVEVATAPVTPKKVRPPKRLRPAKSKPIITRIAKKTKGTAPKRPAMQADPLPVSNDKDSFHCGDDNDNRSHQDGTAVDKDFADDMGFARNATGDDPVACIDNADTSPNSDLDSIFVRAAMESFLSKYMKKSPMNWLSFWKEDLDTADMVADLHAVSAKLRLQKAKGDVKINLECNAQVIPKDPIRGLRMPYFESFGIPTYDTKIISGLLQDMLSLNTAIQNKAPESKVDIFHFPCNGAQVKLVAVPRTCSFDVFNTAFKFWQSSVLGAIIDDSQPQEPGLPAALHLAIPIHPDQPSECLRRSAVDNSKNDDDDDATKQVTSHREAARWLVSCLGQQFRDEFVDAGRFAGVPVVQLRNIDAETSAAMMQDAVLSYGQMRVVFDYFGAIFGCRFAVPEQDMQKLGSWLEIQNNPKVKQIKEMVKQRTTSNRKEIGIRKRKHQEVNWKNSVIA